MKYIFKSGLILLLMLHIISNGNVPYFYVAIILIILILNIIREKYVYSNVLVLFEIFCIAYGAKSNIDFIYMYAITLFDLMHVKDSKWIKTSLITSIMIYTVISIPRYKLFEYLMFIFVCSLFGYLDEKLIQSEKIFRNLYDKERRNRYELEIVKQKLLISSKDIAHIAELNERNRIAREIHDTIGHSIAGILMQLQAAYKIKEKNIEKSYILIEKSIQGLSNSLTVLRDTVHKIKPSQKLGIEYIKSVIDNFKFCVVDFNYRGDFNTIPANIIEIVCTNIKETLTNASKYSCANKIKINIDVNNKYIRLYIKDNGKGCEKIKEGMGISGMKDRIKNVGGTISISGKDGFLIVCIIPLNN